MSGRTRDNMGRRREVSNIRHRCLSCVCCTVKLLTKTFTMLLPGVCSGSRRSGLGVI